MWSFHNPVRIIFGNGSLKQLINEAVGKRYALVTYNEAHFTELSNEVKALIGEPLLTINEVSPNPDFQDLEVFCQQWDQEGQQPEVIIALGGGSVIDTAKVFAAASGDFERVKRYLEGNKNEELGQTPIFAIPTTAGTGSEVTSWATVWHSAENKKYSLNHPALYPKLAIVDPTLTKALPTQLAISTGLDALSHALESLWNCNSNEISNMYAVESARNLVKFLPELVEHPNDHCRSKVSLAALGAGLAFSNTKTALAHNISYPITLNFGLVHGIACSFTLPHILKSMVGTSEALDALFEQIFEVPAEDCPIKLQSMFDQLGISTNYQDYGISQDAWKEIVRDAFKGERGKNFIGGKDTANALI